MFGRVVSLVNKMISSYSKMMNQKRIIEIASFTSYFFFSKNFHFLVTLRTIVLFNYKKKQFRNFYATYSTLWHILMATQIVRKATRIHFYSELSGILSGLTYIIETIETSNFLYTFYWVINPMGCTVR